MRTFTLATVAALLAIMFGFAAMHIATSTARIASPAPISSVGDLLSNTSLVNT
jgi:hypothetical protein